MNSQARPTRAELAAADRGIRTGLRRGCAPCSWASIRGSIQAGAATTLRARQSLLADAPCSRLYPACSIRRRTQLLAHGCGITNFVNRATATAAELMADELVAGGERLLRIVGRPTGRINAVLGITAYRTAFASPEGSPAPPATSHWATHRCGAAQT